ncbi:hypothetical protein EON65_09470 [archaeon]|nr:MAG: hypothetical protein EON65_09470 [archaeon]
MHLAAMHGCVELLEFLIREAKGNASLLATDNYLTPLHAACWKSQSECVALLLEHGNVDVNAKTGDGFTPLHYACWKGSLKSVESLLQRSDCDQMAVNKVRRVLFKLFTSILEHPTPSPPNSNPNSNPNPTHSLLLNLLLIVQDGRTSLMLASRFGHAVLLPVLLGTCPPDLLPTLLDLRDQGGASALMHAAYGAHEDAL